MASEIPEISLVMQQLQQRDITWQAELNRLRESRPGLLADIERQKVEEALLKKQIAPLEEQLASLKSQLASTAEDVNQAHLDLASHAKRMRALTDQLVQSKQKQQDITKALQVMLAADYDSNPRHEDSPEDDTPPTPISPDTTVNDTIGEARIQPRIQPRIRVHSPLVDETDSDEDEDDTPLAEIRLPKGQRQDQRIAPTPISPSGAPTADPNHFSASPPSSPIIRPTKKRRLIQGPRRGTMSSFASSPPGVCKAIAHSPVIKEPDQSDSQDFGATIGSRTASDPMDGEYRTPFDSIRSYNLLGSDTFIPPERVSIRNTNRNRAPSEIPARVDHQDYKCFASLGFASCVVLNSQGHWIEMACPVCQANVNSAGQLMKGIKGFDNHIKSAHPSFYEKLQIKRMTHDQIIELCFFRRHADVSRLRLENDDDGCSMEDEGVYARTIEFRDIEFKDCTY